MNDGRKEREKEFYDSPKIDRSKIESLKTYCSRRGGRPTLSDPPPRRDPFSTSWLPLFQPISPARQPLLSPPLPSPRPVWTAKRGADIADPNYREKNSKRREGLCASRRCNNLPDRRISSSPSPPLLSTSLFFFFLHPFLSFSPSLFLFIPANMAELREARPTAKYLSNESINFPSSRLSFRGSLSFFLYLAISPSKSSAFLLFASRKAIGIANSARDYLEEISRCRRRVLRDEIIPKIRGLAI